ncbi:MAG: arsenate reductase ArsC [Candidatus Kapaibacterium sp.]
MGEKKRILFLCTGNSARSQMAEALMNHLGGSRFTAFSAGTYPAEHVNPFAIETMREMGLDISHNKSKSLDIYLNQPWDIIITVCDNAKESCPIFPGQKIGAHWGFEDPANFQGTDEQKRAFFRKIALEIERRIRLLLALPEDMISSLEYERAVKDIGLD